MNKRYSKESGKRPYRPYRKIVVISTEGKKTEREYFFSLIGGEYQGEMTIKMVKHDSSDPSTVLRQMEKYLHDNKLKKGYLAWLVVDRDQWQKERLRSLDDWSKKKSHYGLAVSNPKFEYWLLLHFEKPPGIRSGRDCMNKLRKHIPGYDKSIQSKKKELLNGIGQAIEHAKRQDSPPCSAWPETTCTTVYRLMEEILRASP